MGSLRQDVDAVMTNGIIPNLNSYVFIAASATTFEIEFIDADGRTLDYYAGVNCPTSSTSLRAIMNTHNPASLAVIDNAVGAFIKTSTAVIYYNTSGDKTTGIPTVPAVATHIRRFESGASYGIGWGN